MVQVGVGTVVAAGIYLVWVFKVFDRERNEALNRTNTARHTVEFPLKETKIRNTLS